MIELKPCPFCGGEAEIKTTASKVCAWGKCKFCGAEGAVSEDENSAKEAWNRRVAE